MKKRIFTIGFTKKSAKEFFEILKRNGIDLLLDIRLNNKSQLAGFSKYPDIEYFLKHCSNADYVHDDTLAPNKELLNDYQNKKIDWNGYEIKFIKLMNERNAPDKSHYYYQSMYSNICLLCSESSPSKCHRRLVAEMFKENNDFEIVHL